MGKQYRLLKDMPGADAGTIFQEFHVNPERKDWIPFTPKGFFAPSVPPVVVLNAEWFEPVEDSDGRWKPQWRQKYWHIDAQDLSVDDYTWTGDTVDNSFYASYNCFRTEALAELAAEKVRECLMRFHKEFAK